MPDIKIIWENREIDEELQSKADTMEQLEALILEGWAFESIEAFKEEMGEDNLEDLLGKWYTLSGGRLYEADED